MALDERDRNFEKALARHLRPNVGSENAGDLRGSGTPRESECPDAEILAAYHERSLSQEELIFLKGHIASCARCQELLVQLELTDSLPVDAETVGAQHSYISVQDKAASLHGAIAAEAGGPARSTKVQTLPTVRKGRLRWVAPAGAIAAGLLVWIMVRENQVLQVREHAPIQMAGKDETPAAPPNVRIAPLERDDAKLDEPSRSASSPSLVPKEKDSRTRSAPVANLPMSGQDKQELRALQQKGAVVGGSLNADQSNVVLDSTGGYRNSSKTRSNQAGGIQQNAETQTMNAQRAVSAALPPPLPTQNQLPLPVASSAQSVDASNEAAQNQAVAAPEARAYSDALALKKVRTTNKRDARLAAAPSGLVVWRVGFGGLIEKSSDGGKTYTRQNSGVKTELVAVSAPNDSICWVVGRAGAILLTVDGGEHWSKVISPLQENVGGVRAVDGLHATIWDVVNRASFATSDGGATWTRVANE